MNPLSPCTYYRRHKRQATLLAGLMTLTTLGIWIMVSLLNSIPENILTINNWLDWSGAVMTNDPTVVSQLRVQPDVAHVIPAREMYIAVPMGANIDFPILGVSETDTPILVDAFHVRLKEGRLPSPRTNEIALSEEIAAPLGLHLGDSIGRPVDAYRYSSIPTELTLVGILEGVPAAKPSPYKTRASTRLGLASLEYLESHEAYAEGVTTLIIIAQEGRKAAVDRWLETEVRSDSALVRTAGTLSSELRGTRLTIYLICGVVEGLVGVVIALIVIAINQIALAQRLSDQGVLHALGHHKNLLARRLALEVTILAGTGWLIGLTLASLSLAWIRRGFYEPRGMVLSLSNLLPLGFTLVIPLLVIALTALSSRYILTRLDSVAIIERGQLSTEAVPVQRVRESSTRPLLSRTFYSRHRRRGILITAATALMIVGIVTPTFLLSAGLEATRPSFGYLRYAAEVWAPGGAIDPAVAAQIRTHPAVARVILTKSLWLNLDIPFSINPRTRLLAVSEDDLLFLMSLYGAQVKEGHLPRPRSNEIVISEALAKNQGLRLGDAIGYPISKSLSDLPTEMEIVGILASDDAWLAFASYEYMESHEAYSFEPGKLLVVPVEERKAELDTWLRHSMDSWPTGEIVSVYTKAEEELLMTTLIISSVFVAVESIIAVVAAIAVVILNIIFFAQRREEFGILHALGHGRSWLTRRAARETLSTAGLAWLIGATVCVIGLLLAQAGIYAPRGLNLNFANPVPWLLTLPIPLTVVAASVGTIGWMLRKLDPVAVIERR